MPLRKELFMWPLVFGIGVLAYQTCSIPPLAEDDISIEEEVTRCPLPERGKKVEEHYCLVDGQCVGYDNLERE